MSDSETLLRLGVAALLGGIIGLERHRSDKAAGLRTHMLVCLGSALVMIVSAHGFDRVLQPSRIVLDPSRIAAQVVSGIGFLGAGTILRRNDTVLGLTTAASIWAVAAIGLAAGAGLYFAAFGSTLMCFVALAFMKLVEDRIPVMEGRRRLTLLVEQGPFSFEAMENAISQSGLELRGIQVRSAGSPEGRQETPPQRQLEVTLGEASEEKLLTFVGRMQLAPGVIEVSYDEKRP
jgi:putative Mg2+ transporter-C (MgtC) family protein